MNIFQAPGFFFSHWNRESWGEKSHEYLRCNSGQSSISFSPGWAHECLWISFACVGIHYVFFLFYADPPTVTVQLESSIDLNTVKEGDDVHLSCEVRANPQPQSNSVTWYHGVSLKCSQWVVITFLFQSSYLCKAEKKNDSVRKWVMTAFTDMCSSY